MTNIVDHRTLLLALGGGASVATEIGQLDVTVRRWMNEKVNRIPVEYWPSLIDLCDRKGVEGINPEWLMNSTPGRVVAETA